MEIIDDKNLNYFLRMYYIIYRGSRVQYREENKESKEMWKMGMVFARCASVYATNE